VFPTDGTNRIVLGLYMADCGAQNTAYANIESRIAPARSFRYPGRVKVNRAVNPRLCHFSKR
jgi:hypothetical protein